MKNDELWGDQVSVVVVEACSRSLAQLFHERLSFTPTLPPKPALGAAPGGLAATDPFIAALGLDGGVAANAAVVSTLAISFLPTEEVRSLARQLLYSLVWLHETCRTSHCDIHIGSVGQFHDGGWRLMNLGHARHFASPLPFPVRARSCSPELAWQLIAEVDVLLEQAPSDAEPKEVPIGPAPTSGTVTIEVEWGKQLLEADRGGVSDPFVRLSLSGQKHETAPQKCTANPRFHQSFDFPAALLGGRNPMFRLEVLGWDKGTSHDFLGEASVDLAAVLGEAGWVNGKLVVMTPLVLGDPAARLSKACKKQAGSVERASAPCGTVKISATYAEGGGGGVDVDVDAAAAAGVVAEPEPEAAFNTVVGPLLSVWSYDMWALGVLLLEAATARPWDAVGALPLGEACPTRPTEGQLRRVSTQQSISQGVPKSTSNPRHTQTKKKKKSHLAFLGYISQTGCAFQLASITDEEIAIRITEVGCEELADLLSLLLNLTPEQRPTAEQLLGKGGGEVRPHRFLCQMGEEAHGWMGADRRRLVRAQQQLHGQPRRPASQIT